MISVYNTCLCVFCIKALVRQGILGNHLGLVLGLGIEKFAFDACHRPLNSRWIQLRYSMTSKIAFW